MCDILASIQSAGFPPCACLIAVTHQLCGIEDGVLSCVRKGRVVYMHYSSRLLAIGVVAMLFRIAAVAQEPQSLECNLEECTSIAVVEHPNVVAATQRMIESKDRIAARRGVKLPQIDFRTDALRYDWLPPNKRNVLGGGTSDVYSAVNLNLLLFSFGRAEARIDSASSSYYAALEDLRRTRQRVAFDVARAFYDVLRLQAIFDARKQGVSQMEHYLKLAREKNEIGKAAKLDVLRAEVQLADVTQSMLLAQNQLEIAHLALANAMGLGSRQIHVDPVSDATPAPCYADVDVFLKEANEINPVYLASQLQTRAAEYDVRAARALFGPNLSLVGSYNREGSDFPDISNWYGGLALNIPIFTGGITRAEVGQARAVVEQRKAGTELINQDITLAVRSAVLSTQDAANRLRATSKSIEQAQEAFNIAQEKYNIGLGSATEVIDTQVALEQARTNYAQALYDGKVAAAALDFAVGRDPRIVSVATTLNNGEVTER